MSWQNNLIESNEGIRKLLAETKRIAVLGIKTEEQSHAPAFYVPEYLLRAGFEVVPVPVYYPDATEILGQKVYRRLADIPGGVDLVNVFRRSQDIQPHTE
ncbi:MAG: CoA-binding protein, partial [Pyrinomonadaceae bacterium]|nr:CoA-binding protein [Pyrinomonadaceae bacterium]